MANQQQNTPFYLKYRPKSLDELVGQTSVKKILLSASEQHKLSHAYLFVGPRGTGKTSTARILAKMINCEKSSESLKADSYPCNKCSTCLSITDGSNLDLIEIDAASNRGIEDIRALREKIKLSPNSARKRVYIIDEVHMLTTEAFNAILKTLEEPPPHAIFILATTESSKIPQTILSRVQRLDFKLATPAELVEALGKIIKAEKIDIDEEGLKLIVKRADGSFRDGIKLLDQISSLGGKITAQLIGENLKSSQFDNLLESLDNLANKDIKKGLLNILSQLKEGIDAKELLFAFMEQMRNLVFIKNGLGDDLVKPYLIDEKYQSLIKLAEQFSNQDLIRDLDILQNALEKLKVTSIPSLPLELAVVEICEENSKLEETSHKLEEKEINSPSSILESPSSIIGHQSSDTDSSDISKLKDKWAYICETIRPYNFSLEALLRSISIKEVTDSLVLIEVPYSFHQRILESPKNRDVLESILSDVLGRQIRVSAVLGSRPQRKDDIANIEVAADDEIIRVAAEIFNSDSIN